MFSLRASVQGTIRAAALVAAVPWAILAILFAPLPWLGVGLALSAAGLILLGRSLGPIARTATLLRDADRDKPDGPLDGEALHRSAARLTARLDALEHRWVRRHAITGLPIRESLLERIGAQLGDRADPVLVGAVRFTDYKRLAAFDPDAAEAALKLFADRLSRSLGKDRPLAHVDRDCFAILFEQAAPEAARQEIAALCYALGAEIETDGLTLIPEVEAGAAVFPDDGTTATALLNQALVSLARMGGAPGARPAEARTADEARERFTIEQGLRLAIERHELELNFQPVVDVSRGVLVGAEALLRWRHPEIGLIGPSRFIPILEDSDLTREIGRWTLDAACREARHWQQSGLGPLKVAVNLSARQLRDDDLKPVIERTLQRHGLHPSALEIELTETAVAEDSERTRALFRSLRAIGVTIAIDDFGAGYSSLSYLKNLPFDKLKIDREFVTEVDQRRDSQAICRSLIALSRGLGIAVLAEGTERVEEVDALQRLGCTLFQGYYFARPLGAEDFMAYALKPERGLAQRDARARQDILRKRIRG